MTPFSIRSLLLATFVLSNCISWTVSRHHHAHNVLGHRSRHRRQGAGLFLSASYVIPGGEGNGWGEWGEVSPCSRTCGGGVASQKRICLQIGPDGQPQCTGGDTKYFSCQTQDCPAGSRDFRVEQCSEFDDVAFRDIKYRWVPYTKAPNPCELNCMPHGERFYYRHRTKVVDGTRCNDESFDVCVNGTCQPVGCDMMLGSSAREDKCRECRGNGANCHSSNGIIDSTDQRMGYNDILLIPEGATSIVIAEIRPSDNYLALRAKNGTYYLNGDYHIDFPRSLVIAGAVWWYERSQQGFAAPDKLRCLGPTNEPLILALLVQQENVGIEYEYSVPTDLAPPTNKRYNWVHDQFTTCTATCAGGYQTRDVTCRSREELEVVDESLCDEAMKPPTNQTCNTQECPAQWLPGPWGKCSQKCGEGGTRSREVFCRRIINNFNGDTAIAKDKECFDLHGRKPELYQECNDNSICPKWFIGPWKPCDKLCDEGKQTRQVVCYQKNGRRIEVLKDELCEEEKPTAEQPCLLQLCEGVDWVLSEWTGCDSCLSKVRNRVATCVTKEQKVVNESFCAYHPTPVTEEECDTDELPPCEVQWYATQWTKCSAECGKGSQNRKVFCGRFDGATVQQVKDSKCAGQTKYIDKKDCEIPQDKCPSQWFTSPWGPCTKTCGGGEQYRKAMCLRGGQQANIDDCDEELVPDTYQVCNVGPCDKDELLPVDEKSTTVMDDDYEDCDDEDYPEVGLDVDPDNTMTTFEDMMFSDGTSEGSGLWSSSTYAELESRFTETADTDSTLSTDELITVEGSGTGSTLETFITDESTDTSITSDSTDTGSTDTGSTDSTLTDETTDTSVTDNSTDSSTVSGSTETDVTDESDSTGTEETGSTESTVTEVTETGSTDATESTVTESTISESTDLTSESGSTESTSESGSTESTSEGSTESTSEGSTESTSEGSTESTSEGSTESTITEETSETGSTESDATTESIESSTSEGTTESGPTSESSTTESGSTESTITEETSETGSTESESTTESGSSLSSDTEGSTTESGSSTVSEETTETGSTETTETGSTETTETGSTDITETGSTETTETGSTETTETESTETTETGGTETTETGSTEITETGSTETTETTESGATETTDSTISSEGTESTSESSTESTSEGLTTPWDWSSTVEVFTKKARMCRPRSCVKSQFGCCPDKKTAAGGPFAEGCPKQKSICKETHFGCCPDGVSPAKGENNRGCPIEPCDQTLFGCCTSDKKTPAEGNDQEGCPPPPPACASSKFGCCKDNETEATGPKKQGCPETSVPTTEGTTISTPSSDCKTSEYGCCFDNQTAASGPEQQGCACSATTFGCCPDGVEAAKGPELDGCSKSCNSSAYGCCPDGKTPAHGHGQEGCCLLYAYGCCPDNFKPAEGPHLEGCGCQYARFGCCPDNVTIATGPYNKGCGCQYSEHGCCPDRHSDASGPEFEGCLCHTYQFGCCPDGVTIARGPNGQGCRCQQSKNGCCGDERTHATGPNQQGCDCSSSKYGCCPDGQTEATGPKFQGCTDIPENKQASCNLAFARGPCRNYSVYWYFDSEYGGCSRFWYGGCEGNGNRFATKEECEDTCVSPPAKDTCKLPQSKGACLGYNVRWYFDTVREMCSNFIYGGCLGNNNNFETREACQAQCEPDKSTDQCNLSIDRGSCAGNYPRWGFNKETRDCDEFIWGGCEGNTNRFSTRAACVQQCNPPGEPKLECSLAQDVGNCTEVEATWAFSQSENRCVPFYYTGCGGNENRFRSLYECEDNCPSAYVADMCTLPAETGDCANYREKWYFDTKDQRCRQFYYGGCGGNANNFNSESECLSRCSPPPTTTTPAAPQYTRPPQPQPQPEPTESFCTLPLDAGPCENLTTRYGYDPSANKCVTFQYGGCGGNRNNFPDEQYCQFYCRPTQDICQLPMSQGPCEESQMKWFYDASSDTCSQFAYGGCEGNDNRFDTREACERRCSSAPAPAPATTVTPPPSYEIPSECRIADRLETCDPQFAGEVWYLDPQSQQCLAHENLPTGAECRTSGVYRSQEGCERACGVFRNLEVCRYPTDAGACKDFVSKYTFNATSGRCEQFAYGGCLGGPNRFSSEQECEDVCLEHADPCKQPPEPGNCLERYVLWYYDESRDSCNQFIFGGCGGNSNKFESRDACERRCRKQPNEVSVTTTTEAQPERVPQECATPSSLDPCGSNVTVFYYDEAASACRVADTGACGYPNSYNSEEECERRCGAFRGIDVCRAQLDPGPCRAAIIKYYFDAASGSCKEYTYGGCRGGPNRFSSSEECRDLCGDSGPAPQCLEPVTTGSSECGASPVRRWHYSPGRADCLVFAYQGCAGTRNNFRSYDECSRLCRPRDQDSALCDRYSEECLNLESTCEYGVTVSVAAEGCERCACAPQRDCSIQQEHCSRIQCQFGVNRTATDDGCEACSCTPDPCARSNCSSKEKCIAAAYRDPNTQAVQYSAQCVPDTDTNEVLDCEEAEAACASLSCAYGVQRTRSAGGCERCACVTEEVDCATLTIDCKKLKCTYGMDKIVGDDGCERCKCLEHPCANKQCPEGERCAATPYRDPVTQENKYSSDCRTVNKPGTCPVEESTSTESSCRRECNDDADCRGVGKCCARGCSQLCRAPAQPTTPGVATPYTTLAPPGDDIPGPPQASQETEPEVTAAEGGMATLRCIFHGNPPPKITWRRGEITIDGDVGRYRILSDGALEIVSLYRNDSGVYICVADNGLGIAEQEVRLEVNDPVVVGAGIAGESGAGVRAELGAAVALRCLAYGHPEPSVYWYRGVNGPLVAFNSPAYEYLDRGRTLLIRRLSLEELGEYACQAYNGHGKPATWLVVVQAFRPEGASGEALDSAYLVARESGVVEVTPRRQTDATITTPQQEIELQPYIVPVETKLLPASTNIMAGAELSLPCEVEGYPEPRVTWMKDGNRLLPTDSMWITNSRLTIRRVSVSDSGEYTCRAANSHSQHESRVTITVTERYVPAKCTDSPYFANCKLIVDSNFCRHTYYSRFCCKSCVEAGQLDPRDVDMQADAPFRKK